MDSASCLLAVSLVTTTHGQIQKHLGYVVGIVGALVVVALDRLCKAHFLSVVNCALECLFARTAFGCECVAIVVHASASAVGSACCGWSIDSVSVLLSSTSISVLSPSPSASISASPSVAESASDGGSSASGSRAMRSENTSAVCRSPLRAIASATPSRYACLPT